MKKSTQFLLRLYMNYWYVPLLVFLVGIKICLVSFLVTSIQSGDRENLQSKTFGQWGQVHKIKNGKVALGNFTKSFLTKRSANQKQTKGSKEHPLGKNEKLISQQMREEWALLAHLEKARIRPSHANRTEAESIWLIFNRIPRCGGGTLVKLLETLAERNGFSHQTHEYRTPWPRFLLEQEQESLVTWFEYQHLPKSYDRHFYFVNFTRYQKYVKEKPIYVNIMRDPVDRIRSDYLARRTDKELSQMEILRRDEISPGSGMKWFNMGFNECVLTEEEECKFENGTMDFTLAVPFFCGQHNSCVIINDKWGLQMAKFTIERHYSVVGVLERMDQTLSVFENYVPKFFSGVAQFYTDSEITGNVHHNSNIPNAVRQILEKKLHAEVDLYKFVLRRLALQYAHLQGTY